jgi:hypothetical protein
MTPGREPGITPLSGTGPDGVLLATWGFIWLGVLLRVVTFALNFPLWGDEAFVAVNLIRRGYWELLRPLDYAQICPLLFLWLELTAVKLLGFSEWSLRLIPTACSVGSVFLFAHAAGRVTSGVARLLAVAIFSVAYYPIRHGAEVKQYSTDLLAALVLLALAIEWLRMPENTRWLWALVAAVPLAIGLSHPAVFVAGAISLVLAAKALKRRLHGVFVPLALYNLVMVFTFLALFAVFTREQARVYLSTLRSNYWAEAFPPVGEPAKFLCWLAETHTGRMFAYPFGEARGGSSFTTLCFVVALVALWRRRQRALLALLLGPFGFTLLASLVGRYPYGTSARTMIFVAPSVCLLGGLGLATMIASMRYSRSRRWALRASVTGLAAAGFVLLSLTLAAPYKCLPDQNSRSFARVFWTEHAKDSELVCVKSDLGLGFRPRNWTLFRSALYLCNQRIYSPRHRLGVGASWNKVSALRPLRCVLYNEWPENDPACSAWLKEMTKKFEVRNCQTFVVNESTHRDDGTDLEDRYTVYDFVPRGVAPLSRVVLDPSQPAPRHRF